MTTDPRWQVERRDPLSRFTGLRALQKDPLHGASVTIFIVLFEVTMLVLELAFLFVKFFCASASIYLWKLTTQTQIEAVRIRLERDQILEDLHQARAAASSAHAKSRPLMRVA